MSGHKLIEVRQLMERLTPQWRCTSDATPGDRGIVPYFLLQLYEDFAEGSSAVLPGICHVEEYVALKSSRTNKVPYHPQFANLLIPEQVFWGNLVPNRVTAIFEAS
jgi:hypothetical protein